nr:MFS transporter [Candidatus Sigynarchaeota archaeon]
MNANESVEGNRPKNYVTFVVVLMGLISLLDNYLAQVEMGVFTYMATDFGIPQNELLIWISLYGVVAFAVFLINWFNDAFGRKKGLILLVIMLGAPSLLLTLTPSGPVGMHPALLLYSIITMATLSNAWEIPVAEESPAKKRGLYGAIAFLMGMIPIYAILGPRIAESPLGWKWAYGLWGLIFMILCLVLLIFFFKEPERWLKSKAERKNKLLNIKAALKSMTRKDVVYVLILSGVYFIWSSAFKMGTLRFQDYYDSLGLLTQYNKIYLIVGGLLTVVGALLSGILMDKVGRRPTLVIGCVGSIASFILVPVTNGSPIALWGIFTCMPIVLAWITVYMTEIFTTKNRGTCMGCIMTISRAAYVVGPALASLYLPMGWPAYWVFAGLLMIIPIIALLVKPYEAKHKTIEQIETERDGKK